MNTLYFPQDPRNDVPLDKLAFGALATGGSHAILGPTLEGVTVAMVFVVSAMLYLAIELALTRRRDDL